MKFESSTKLSKLVDRRLRLRYWLPPVLVATGITVIGISVINGSKADTPQNPYLTTGACQTPKSLPPTLKIGSSGDCVRRLQWSLNHLELTKTSSGATFTKNYGLLETGTYDQSVAAAVKDFQTHARAVGCSVSLASGAQNQTVAATGVVNLIDWQLINAYSNSTSQNGQVGCGFFQPW